MKLLIVAATPFEIQPCIDHLSQNFEQVDDFHFKSGAFHIHILITGVGLLQTAFAMGHVLARHSFQLAINAGIAGAFNETLKIGDVVQVISEQMGDLGVEERDGQFTDVFEMGLISADQPPFKQGLLTNESSANFDFLPKCKGLSINKVHGTDDSISSIRSKYTVDVETMEGAAFFHACLVSEQPFIEIRSISNYVEPRNRDNWNLPLAISQLNQVLIEILSALKPSSEE